MFMICCVTFTDAGDKLAQGHSAYWQTSKLPGSRLHSAWIQKRRSCVTVFFFPSSPLWPVVLYRQHPSARSGALLSAHAETLLFNTPLSIVSFSICCFLFIVFWGTLRFKVWWKGSCSWKRLLKVTPMTPPPRPPTRCCPPFSLRSSPMLGSRKGKPASLKVLK